MAVWKKLYSPRKILEWCFPVMQLDVDFHNVFSQELILL